MHSIAILDYWIVDVPDRINVPAELAAGEQDLMATLGHSAWCKKGNPTWRCKKCVPPRWLHWLREERLHDDNNVCHEPHGDKQC
jgi:hypothetical protein